MSCLRSLPKISTAVFLITQALFASQAMAAGFQINEISPALQGSATAGAAAAQNDVTAMFTNPATLGSLDDNQLYVGASAILPVVHMNGATAGHGLSSPGSPNSAYIMTPVDGDTSQNNIAHSAVVPAGYFGWKINNNLIAGLAITAPFGLSTYYDSSSALRYIAQDSSIETVNVNPVLALKINDMWSIGAGVQAQYANAHFSNYNGLAPTFPTSLTGGGWGYGYNMGFTFNPFKTTHVGVGYRSQITEDLNGSGRQYTITGPTFDPINTGFLYNSYTKVDTSVKTPAVLTMSIAQDINDWTVKASAQLNFWKCFNQLDVNMPDAYITNSTINTKWSNSWLYALGADYRVSPKWTLRAGVAYDETPTHDEYRDPRIPDSNRIWATTGFSYKITKNVALEGAYEHIFMQNQKVNVTQYNGTNSHTTIPAEVNSVQANYTGHADILALGVRYYF